MNVSEMISKAETVNLISAFLVILLLISVIQGIFRGAFGSAKYLLSFILEGILTIISIFAAWKLAGFVSPYVQDWLISLHIAIPPEKLTIWRQIYYTFITGVRDFSLMRISVLFILGYIIIKQILYWISSMFTWIGKPAEENRYNRKIPWYSSFIGGGIGVIVGMGRMLIFITVLYVYTTLFTDTTFAQYIQKSNVYQQGSKQFVEPYLRDFVKQQLPVLTQSVQKEFNQILQRKYEIIDSNIPNNISDTAKQVTAGDKTDEQKARDLYHWVASRVQYDWNKVNVYENQQIWEEQSPEDTFHTKKGVCIDYSRLYAVMAKAIHLQVRIETGLGYDGQGNYGSHAWNVVYLSEKNKWVPVDATWGSGGGNWFNTPDFYKTHIKES